MAFPRTPKAPAQARAADRTAAQSLCVGQILSKPRASFKGGSGVDIAWHRRTGADVNDVNDVPSLSEPYGPDVAMADRGRSGAEISQSGAARRLGQAIWPARRVAGTDLALLPHLSPAGLRHRPGHGR